VFFDKGFGRATMGDIAKKAELSSGTLYLYFKNKNELYGSLTLRIMHYLVIRLEQLHHEYDMDEAGKIKALKIALMDVYEFDPLILRCLFLLQSNDSLKQLSPELADGISSLGQKALNLIADIFTQATKKGICFDLPPKAIANIAWSLFSGAVMLEFSKGAVEGQQDNLRRQLELAFRIFEKGIRVDLHCAAVPAMGECSTVEAESTSGGKVI
jgi:AcrR family transcriptional regulator